MADINIEAEWQTLDRMAASGLWPAPWQLRRWRDVLGQQQAEIEKLQKVVEHLRERVSHYSRRPVPREWAGPKEDF